ncbi:DNA polymerase III subunit gamma/tau [Acetivibrio clariflavus]|uniref:DNA-directed DNA polymerase n=1 Tax=Acetivibrio clariflavus (strain DSM 19732 / NBRC 101661 / EBR45) TaxID=720554 RepID=G8M081_ACECE|nr:DNA polymerase III subunit gamma/tau [Acetivibrio clariflavus]AEV66888.1 DNA polymerase III, subunit gamma/tau [Acetivibrio clariflavus DSM 19732]
MSYLALYRKWRPMVFEDVVEQEHVVKTLKNSILAGRIAHAYLFCGTRGTGKTTMAKIFSRAINCLNSTDGDPCNECEICKGILNGSLLDVIEIDAASNNSVDNVREIRDEVVYAPSKARYKVYIIDEVHMLSTGAFNALLKTLEEPPSHVVFILATTEPHKLPATILSRCQRFDFRRIPVESIVKRIRYIAENSGVSIEEEGLRLIARMSDGALRDAISILDQCISLGNKHLTYEDVLSIVGIVNNTFVADVVDAINAKEVDRVLQFINVLVMDGKNITQFVSDLILYYRNLLICSTSKNPEEIVEASKDMIERMKEQCKSLSHLEITSIIKELSALENTMRWSNHARILLEVALIKLCETKVDLNDAGMTERLDFLEKKINHLLESGVEVNSKKSKDCNAGGKKEDDMGESSADGTKSDIEVEAHLENLAGNLEGMDIWNDVLNDLKQDGKMALYSYLLDTKAIQINNRIVGIVFPKGRSIFKINVSKSENAEILENYISKRLGREIRIKCLDSEEIVDREESSDKEYDEFVEKAKAIAEELNAPLEIVDE